MFCSSLALFSLFLAATAAVPFHLENGMTMVNTLHRRDLIADLGPQLSSHATLYSPNSSDWATQSSRWSTYSAPTFQLVVAPAVDEDIVAVLRYATSHNISFLAQGGGHGYSPTLGAIQNAIMINMENYDTAVYNSTDYTITIGGGARFSHMINVTHEAGRELTVGSCPCVGAVGATLGGGHGRLQGKHALTSDAIVSMRIILANGAALTASSTENTDLFYGMKGAGQNYGIVTSVTLSTYEQVPNGMHYNADMVFANSSLESVLQIINDIIPNQPGELALDLLFVADPTTLDTILYLNLVYAGPASKGSQYAALFNATNVTLPLSFTSASLSWSDLPFLSAGGAIAAACARGNRQNTYSVNFAEFDIPTMRAAFNAYGDFVRANPAGAGTLYLFEVFGQGAVNAVDPTTSAYANRGHDNVLAILEAAYTDDSVAEAADELERSQRDAFAATSGYDGLYVYQNYAHGDEPLEALYGYEAERLDRLRALKRTYDPADVFYGYHDVNARGKR